MKERLVQLQTQSDNTYGQVSSPDDVMLGQQYAHDHANALTNDFINDTNSQEVKGFAYQIEADNALEITIKTPGRVYIESGVPFELEADTTLPVAAADQNLPHYDLIVAKIEDQVASDPDLIPFVRLDLDEQINITVPTELHWKATAQIKTGTPGITPAIPNYASDEIPLYVIGVPAGALAITTGNIRDLRDQIVPLRLLVDSQKQDRLNILDLTNRVTTVEDLRNVPIDLSGVFGEIRTLGDLLTQLSRQTVASGDIPEIRYDNPPYPLTDPRSSQVNATGGSASSVPYVDIPVGPRINFGDKEVIIQPQNFADQTLNPHYTVETTDPSHVSRSVAINLGTVKETNSNGSVDFGLRNSLLNPGRANAAAAARDSQFIEIFGGGSSSGGLSDWLEYDLINDTLTPKTPSTTLPAANYPFMASFGDGTHVLLCTSSATAESPLGGGTGQPQWWKLNCATGHVDEITTTKPSGNYFFGSLLTAGKIFVAAQRNNTGAPYFEFWEYDTGTGLFTQVSPTGAIPEAEAGRMSGCMLAENKFVLLTYPTATPTGKTYVYDRTSQVWTQIPLTAPVYIINSVPHEVYNFEMANVNGRILMVGGSMGVDSGPTWDPNSQAIIWELQTSGGSPTQWVSSVTSSFVRIAAETFCSSLGGTNLPNGKSFMFGGTQGSNPGWSGKIYSTVQQGITGVSFNGVDGVSLGPGSTFAQFELSDVYTASWQVAAYLGTLAGSDTGSVMIEVSLDGGTNWHQITNGQTFAVTDSATPGVRKIRITIQKVGPNAPIITGLSEVLNQTSAADIESRQVIRFNTPTSGAARGLYIDRNGNVYVQTTIVPSDLTQALILKLTPNTTSAPTVKKYINRRGARVKYTGTRSAGVTPTFSNELAVPVRYVNAVAVAVASSNAIRKIADPTVNFDDSAVAVADLGTNADYYIVEVAS